MFSRSCFVSFRLWFLRGLITKVPGVGLYLEVRLEVRLCGEDGYLS